MGQACVRKPAIGRFERKNASSRVETVESQVGYHRLLLAFSLAVLCACFVLPAPGPGGDVRLPFLEAPLPSLCMLKREYGIDCPGCGLTRCFLAMAHTRVAAAWHYHPVGVLLFGAVVAQIPYRLIQIRRLRRGQPELSHWTLRASLWLILVLFLAQWIMRTIETSAS